MTLIKHLLHVCIVLIALHILINLTATLLEVSNLLFPFYRLENYNTKKLNIFPVAIQLISAGAGIGTQVVFPSFLGGTKKLIL